MSWFDTSGFASLAKTALKEAQKTIDKALDIKDEDPNKPAVKSTDNSPDFFDSWGVEGDESKPSTSQRQQNTSIWGSFTGSFFENPKDDMTAVVKRPESFTESNESLDKLQSSLVSSKSFPDSLSDKTGDKSSPGSAIIQTIIDPNLSPATSKSASIKEIRCESANSEDLEKQSSFPITQDQSIALDDVKTSAKIESVEDRRPSISEGSEVSKRNSVIRRKKEQSTSHALNRLSILSVESDRKSSESVEVLGSQSDCTCSPDSEITSLSTSVGQKANSESVEVLPDSLVTSPSSVEVLAEWKSDESPFMSPIDDRIFETSITPTPSDQLDVSFLNESSNEGEDIKSSTSTLEGSRTSLARGRDIGASTTSLDDASLADDSYASASESTLMTIMESLQAISDSESRQMMSTSTGSLDFPLNLSIESLKDKPSLANLHLPLEAITKQPHRNDQQQTETLERLKSSTIEPAEVPEPSSSSSKKLSTSSYVKTMLADAMSDGREETERHAETVRDNSPISSESRSDLVKIGSDQTSGHTSGDEMETTTSSDIEIISSPNGDSSSTQSRQSPAKHQQQLVLQQQHGSNLMRCPDLLTKTLKQRGHSRELSEISVGSDDANLEVERLLRRVREMTEIIEARESKLIEVSRSNMELHELNSSLKKQLDNKEKQSEQSQDITQITDEYTQRLSALERKFQQAIRERDSLRKSLDTAKQEAATRPSSVELSRMSTEKDEIIRELREEGEKLSKQQLQHSNIIKKLRAKDKENEALIKSQKEQLEEQTTELERLKRSLHAKEEVERSQIEAVHTLTAKCKKQEKEILSLQEKLDHVTNKMEAYKKSFDAAKTELLETKEKLGDTEAQLKVASENAGESHLLLVQVEDLKLKLRRTEETHVKKEESSKQEKLELLKRLESAESRSEEMSESASQATKPLLRQIEQLQTSLANKTSFHLRQEESMNERIADLQSKLDATTENSRSLSEETANLKSRCSVLESKLVSRDNEKRKLEERVEGLTTENKKLADENKVHKQAMKMLEEAHANEIKELKREISSLESKVSIEKAAVEAEKRKTHAALEQQQSTDDELRLSPTLSIERDSVSSANSIWPAFNDSVFDTSSGRFPNIYGTNSTSMIENLQAQLKQRDGEVQQLQWDLSHRNTERDALNMEVSTLTSKVEDLSASLAEMETIKESLNDIQTKYDALLQMYGEKVEENEELRLDLDDVKEMYKTQIDQLLQRDL
ncbi:hypothetical protein QAD02_006518 [Eretmocerus hayati]|uniref:Uncharacterized protein n=1 Tax=Eretmocerus hayati TaxID=131215 RepID=A0ACC2N298_9HYME|nr:hypothetical protein QAD02_006518 [Eretmocerus hayati]